MENGMKLYENAKEMHKNKSVTNYSTTVVLISDAETYVRSAFCLPWTPAPLFCWYNHNNVCVCFSP